MLKNIFDSQSWLAKRNKPTKKKKGWSVEWWSGRWSIKPFCGQGLSHKKQLVEYLLPPPFSNLTFCLLLRPFDCPPLAVGPSLYENLVGLARPRGNRTSDTRINLLKLQVFYKMREGENRTSDTEINSLKLQAP